MTREPNWIVCNRCWRAMGGAWMPWRLLPARLWLHQRTRHQQETP